MPHFDLRYRRVTDIPLDELRKRGIRLLLLDLDNTLAPYYVGTPTEEVLAWARKMREGGVELMIYSNNTTERPAMFSGIMGIEYRKKMRKPRPEGVLAILKERGLEKSEVAVVGDQIYTDILCANNAGVVGILLEPIKLVRPAHIIRYIAELPFR